MAKGKSQYAVWRCPDCNTPIQTTYYNKSRNDEIRKEVKKFCKKCKKRVMAKRKDAKKGN